MAIVAELVQASDTDWQPCIDDESLIRASQDGDIDAFNMLVEQHQQRVYAVCFRMLGESDAADATQEVFLSMYRHINLYRGGSFISWLLRIARNECYDQLRARKRRPQFSIDDDEAPMQIKSLEAPHDELLMGLELADEIQRCLMLLDPDQRMVIVLSGIEGYSYDEIATITGFPLGTVKSRISRGRAQLRNALSLKMERRAT